MPIYEITVDGEEYEVDAPDEETALAALNLADQTTVAEDIQGFGTKILDGLLFGFGDEAASAALAAIDSTRARILGKEASVMGEEDFSASFDKMLARQQDVEQRFQEQSPGIALAAEVAGGVGTGLLTGAAALKGAAKLAGKAGTTRAANAAASAAVGAVEGSTYALGEKQGDIGERINSLGMQDVLIAGLGAAAGAVGGSLVRGTAPESKTLGELADAAMNRVSTAAQSTAIKAKDVAEDIGELAFKAAESVSPSLAKAGRDAVSALSDTTGDMMTALRPKIEEVQDGFDKWFQPVKDYAEKKVSKPFSARLNRGAINGQRVINKIDQLFEKNKMFELRDSIEAAPNAPLLKAAIADYANPELSAKQRAVALRTVRRELNDKQGFNNFRRFIKEQESYLNDIAKGTQSFKRNRGYMSIAADRTDKKSDLATETLETLEAERKAAEQASRLSTADVSAKQKLKVARLNADGTGLSKVGEEAPVMNPVDSHHYWMRSHAQLNEVNKVLGIKAATTAEELAEIAKGSYFGKRLESVLRSSGLGDEEVGNAVEIYNQVVWGSQRSMAKELQALRNVGYASAIGNPYGAALQFHDVFNSAWANGRRETFEALANKNGFKLSVEDVGVAQQIHSEIMNRAKRADGSFVNSTLADWAVDRSQKLVDFSMKYSGFKGMDGWAKGKIMSAALGKEFNQLAANASKWRAKWRYTFNRAEIAELEEALKNKDTSNELVKQLALINLSDLQPISSASSSLKQLSLPQVRILYMLKGFAMTQLQLIRKRVGAGLKTRDKAKRKEALKDMLAYFLISGGGYGVVNESRQILKGESPDYGNVPMLAFYQMMSIPTIGAFGGNQYAAHLFAQNPYEQITSNFLPVVPVVEGLMKDVSNLFTKGEVVPNETLERMPLIGPIYKAVSDKLDEE
jgi:hypothetical protein